MYRDFNLINSYTIESSCYGFDVKDSQTEEIRQFKEGHFLAFGETLVEAITEQLDVQVTELDKMMEHGLKIELNFGLH